MREAGHRRGVARQRGKLALDLPAIHHIRIIKSCTTQYQCAGRLLYAIEAASVRTSSDGVLTAGLTR